MSNDLSIISNNQSALANLAAVASQAQQMRLLKFVKGKWLIGDDEVSADRQFIAHAHQLVHGWVKFEDRKVVEQRVGIVADGFKLAERDELGDTDESRWGIENGEPKDPWSRQYYLPLEDPETGELFTFVTGSKGGDTAIGRLTNQFLRNVRNGLPIVRLEIGFYKHKQYGRTEVPEFKVVGWTGASGNFAPGGGGRDMNDDIPF
jgi:hypothetical protein